MSGCVALIVAAGRGARLGGVSDVGPKQYLPLAGRPILARAVEAFRRHAGIDAVRVVIHGDDRERYDAALGGLDILPPVTGGDTRQDSVRLGLESLAEAGFDTVLIHDAARPLVSRALIDGTLAGLAANDGVAPAIAVTDSLKRASELTIEEHVDRTGLWRAQTPQGFKFGAILDAHRRAADGGRAALSDDAAVASAAGMSVAIVPGEEENVKVTTSDDLRRAEGILAARTEYRTGLGLDVHAFAAEGSGPVRLCGIDIPHERGLAGHSDADAALHAATDAILGALAEGDIGRHFPPGDAAWKNADSRIFLRRAAEIAADRGAALAHLDITLICEVPKIAPHAEAMRARIAEILDVETGRVSVKATTTEGLGALGRGDGIAAQAIATLAVERRL